jgi:hypothetical protein
MLRIEDLSLDVVEIDDRSAEAIAGGTDWICTWPDDPTGRYYPGPNPTQHTYWHYYDYTTYQWINTWQYCGVPGYITST